MKLHFLVSISFLLLSSSSVTNSCYDGEREALLSFKSNLIDPSNPISQTLQIQWAKPTSVLSNLRWLQLCICRCSCKIPADQFLNLIQLYLLVMDFNFLTSQIPGQLANLTSLSILDLTTSNLQGSIPYLPQPKEPDVGGNSNPTVDLNSLFSVLWVHVEVFDIQSTHVIVTIPTSLANINSLVHFITCNCLIKGPLPSSIANLSRLESLDLNKIVGQLSPSISSLKGLRLLSLIQNSLEGPIPDSICNISTLQDLSLLSNSFTGKLPDCINQLHNLIIIQISLNKVNGTIPQQGFSGLIVKVDQDPSPPNFQPQVLELRSSKIEAVTLAYLFEHMSNISKLNESNYSNWNEQLLMALGCLDLDLSLRTDESNKPTNTSSVEEKTLYENWEYSNRLIIMIIKSMIEKNIRKSIPAYSKERDFLAFVEQKFRASDKAIAEEKLKREELHSVHMVSQGHEGKRPKKGNKPPKKEKKPISFGASDNMDKGNICKKKGHLKKDCQKRKKQFEKRGIHFNPKSK